MDARLALSIPGVYRIRYLDLNVERDVVSDGRSVTLTASGIVHPIDSAWVDLVEVLNV